MPCGDFRQGGQQADAVAPYDGSAAERGQARDAGAPRADHASGWCPTSASVTQLGTCNAAIDPAETFGAEANPTGSSIGGGSGYCRIVTDGAYRVANATAMLDALGKAKAGETVFVEPTASIDLTGRKAIGIPAGVTLASNRGQASSTGALLFTTDKQVIPLFVAKGANVRFTGLRLRGANTDAGGPSSSSSDLSSGIQTAFPGLEVDNCEISGWTAAGVTFFAGATDGWVHHCYIHHNRYYWMGYGVMLSGSNTGAPKTFAIIEANTLEDNRHAVAGGSVCPSDQRGEGYEARWNLVLPHADGTGYGYQTFDMHGADDYGLSGHWAGDLILIHHNTVRHTAHPAVVIRGIPVRGAEIHHNWFLHDQLQSAVVQSYATGNMSSCRNLLTANKTLVP